MTDVITRELITSSLLYASEEMGIALRNSSYSPNIKERMDHSAALFDLEGRLLAQAEHIPVHLGSLPLGLKNTLQYCEREGIPLERGSMIVVNNPYIAGTHLNDVTVVRPIFFPNGGGEGSGSIVAFAANKAHHSDVGGKVPGSISVDATSVFEEGFLLNPVRLMKADEFVPETLAVFSSNSRTPVERLGDLKAQVAANFTGERRVLDLINKYGWRNFREACESSFDYAKRLMRKRLSMLRQGTYRARDYLEHPDGRRDITLKVKVTVSTEGIEIDYTGTDGQLPIPLNAVFGVTLSGAHYVARTLTGREVPPNHGAFSSIRVHAPKGTVLNPVFPAPVAGGNVETSQRNADLLYKALSTAAGNVPAAAGGSMNNVMAGGVFRQKPWAYYETSGVGLGGRSSSDGIDGIQCNMTNTMNTPIEDIERSLPFLVERYEFREDSSGAGEFRGGSGVVRSFRSMSDSPIVFTVLAERGRHKPWGLRGGTGGANTKVSLSASRGETKNIPIKSTNVLRRDDSIEISTAGGGGYGSPWRRKRSKVLDDLADGIITREYARRSGYRF